VDITVLESCPVAGFGIRSVERSASGSRVN
jgi:hypothetical protein